MSQRNFQVWEVQGKKPGEQWHPYGEYKSESSAQAFLSSLEKQYPDKTFRLDGPK